jgi:hypothetical protein
MLLKMSPRSLFWVAAILASLLAIRWQAGLFSVSVSTSRNLSYALQAKDSLPDTTWASRASVAGDGMVKSLEDDARGSKRFHRLVEQPSPLEAETKFSHTLF